MANGLSDDDRLVIHSSRNLLKKWSNLENVIYFRTVTHLLKRK